MSHRVRTSRWVLAFSAAMVASPLAAQSAPDDLRMFLVAHGDSVRVLLTESPPTFGGFVVYRRLAGGASPWERRTPQPIRRVMQPAMVSGLIGPDLPAVRQALGTTDDGELLRRLQTDDFAAYLLSLLYPQVGVALGRLFDDVGLERGASYEYRVAMIDNRGEETGQEIIGPVRIADILPAPPTEVTATPGPGAITVAWSYPAYSGNPTDLVIAFHVYRGEGAGPTTRITGRPVVRNDVGPLEFADTLVVEGARYRYEVRAVDMIRRESAPAAGAPITVTDVRPPRVPTGVEAVAGEGVVTVSWQPTPDTDVLGYHIERSTGLDQPYVRLTDAPVPANAPFEDRTATGGTPYFYRVVAVDRSGNVGRPSNAIAVLPVDTTPPAAPTGVSVTAVDRTLEVRWTASSSADVRGYYVYRGETTDRLVRLVEQPVSGTSFVDAGYGGAGLTPGRRYAVRVSAVDHSFNESEPVDAQVTVTDDEPPAPPTGLRAVAAGGRHVEIAWSASPSLDVRAYEVARSAASGEPPVAIAEAAADQRTVRDTTATAGSSYTYRVVAVDSAGNRSVAAEIASTFADATAPPAPRYAAAVVTGAGVEISWERVVADDLVGYHVYRALVPTGVFERLTDAPVSELRFTDAAGRAEHYYRIHAVDASANESAPSPVVRGRMP